MVSGQALTAHTFVRKKQVHSQEAVSGEVIIYQLTPAELAEVRRKYGPPGTIRYPERLTDTKGYSWAARQKKKKKER
ncbi:MAG: hypothetical protein ABF683_05600 [Sporolactobacillus sp.]